MSIVGTMPVKQLNEEIVAAREAETQKGELPDFRNFYILHFKPNSLSTPMEKRFYRKGGFNKTLRFCENYCEKKGYRFMTLAPMFADLDYELSGGTTSTSHENQSKG